MPKKKLKVRDVGAGDPTFVMIIQFENEDAGDTARDITLKQTSGQMNPSNPAIKNPILYLDETTFPVGEDIVIMSSFAYDAVEPTFQNGIIPATTSVTFNLMPDSKDVLDIENETTDPTLNAEVEMSTITFDEVNAFPARRPTLGSNFAASLQAVANNPEEQGNYVFLEGSGAISTKIAFISTVYGAIWDIVCYGDYYTIQNRANKMFLGTVKLNGESRVSWFTESTASDIAGIQWNFINDNPNTCVLQNVYAVNQRMASYFVADTQTGIVSMSEKSTPWYLHNIDGILTDIQG